MRMLIDGWRAFSCSVAVRMDASDAKSSFNVVTLFPVSFSISLAAFSALSMSRHASTTSAAPALQ